MEVFRNIFINIMKWLYSLNVRYKADKDEKTIKKIFANSESIIKNSSNGVEVALDAKEKATKEKINVKTTEILKKTHNNFQELCAYLEKSGTKIYTIKDINKHLSRIGETTGFIAERKGLKALYISFLLHFFATKDVKISFNTTPVFIFDEQDYDFYKLVHNLHKWCSFNEGLSGFEQEAVSIANKISESGKNNNCVDKLIMSEVLRAREVIARNLEAGKFVITYAKKFDGAKQALKKIQMKNDVVL